jgi:hypothetical protein
MASARRATHPWVQTCMACTCISSSQSQAPDSLWAFSWVTPKVTYVQSSHTSTMLQLPHAELQTLESRDKILEIRSRDKPYIGSYFLSGLFWIVYVCISSYHDHGQKVGTDQIHALKQACFAVLIPSTAETWSCVESKYCWNMKLWCLQVLLNQIISAVLVKFAYPVKGLVCLGNVIFMEPSYSLTWALVCSAVEIGEVETSSDYKVMLQPIKTWSLCVIVSTKVLP